MKKLLLLLLIVGLLSFNDSEPKAETSGGCSWSSGGIQNRVYQSSGGQWYKETTSSNGTLTTAISAQLAGFYCKRKNQ